MPRVSTVKIEEENTAPKKRAPRKRVAVSSEDAVIPRPRARRATPKRVVTATSEEPVREEEKPIRRAPTPLHAERQAAKHSSRILIGVSIMLIIFSGMGIAIGMSDRGAIDVVAVVNERNEKIGRGEVRDNNNDTVTQTVPVQNTDTRPNGGLIPMDPADAPTPTAVTPVAASTTEDTATSTDSTTGLAEDLETEKSADEVTTDSVE